MPQDQIMKKLEAHLTNPKNTQKLELMRFLANQPVPKTLDLTYFGKYHVKANTQKESEKHSEVQRQV